MQLICVPPEETWKIWPGVRALIDSGFAASDMLMPEDLKDQLKYGTRLLWLAVDEKETIVAAMLTQLFEMRSGPIVKMMECGGSQMREWLHFRTEIEEYAKREGCGRVVVEGRPGWRSVLPDYRVRSVILEKRI